MVKQRIMLMTLLICLLSSSILVKAQSTNLLQNPNASEEALHWRAMGQATIEERVGGDRCFVVRNGGYFYQDVELPEDVAGQYAVLIGRGSSERINPDGAITGLSYLYGYIMDVSDSKGGHILNYLRGQQMLSSSKVRDEWVDLWGIFKVPDRAKTIRFFLNQALRGGVPHNGSAARFDSLGLYLFSTADDAKAFVSEYH